MTKVFKIAYFVGENGESWYVLKAGKERYRITPFAAANGVKGVIDELGFDPFSEENGASGSGRYSITPTMLRAARRNKGMAGRKKAARRWVSLYKRKGGWGGARKTVDIDREMWENLVDEAARICSYEPLLKLGALAESAKLRKRFAKEVLERQRQRHEEQRMGERKGKSA